MVPSQCATSPMREHADLCPCAEPVTDGQRAAYSQKKWSCAKHKDLVAINFVFGQWWQVHAGCEQRKQFTGEISNCESTLPLLDQLVAERGSRTRNLDHYGTFHAVTGPRMHVRSSRVVT